MIVPLNTVHTPYESDGVWAIADKKAKQEKILLEREERACRLKKIQKTA